MSVCESVTEGVSGNECDCVSLNVCECGSGREWVCVCVCVGVNECEYVRECDLDCMSECE